MNWKKTLEGAGVAVGSALFAALGPLVADGSLDRHEIWVLSVLVGSVFFSYLKTNAPVAPKE